ncbi:hypothetical protein [Nocardia lasii]|uniref:Knr4/Smi1-like domain-containing protein n=1 Tax=Nocardia lasii TaxID=1616107 RepID=A0ABW1JS72_9NOCA
MPHGSISPSPSITEQWGRVAAWLRANLSSVTLNGAEPADLTRTIEAIGGTWPAELSTLFTHINGFAREHWVRLLPLHDLFDLDRLVREYRVELEVWGDVDADMVPHAPLAGDTAGTYLRQFVPFAGEDGNLLFVDTRPGPLHGCVSEFDKVSADGGPRWASLSAMFADLADSLETGAVFDQYWAPSVEQGELCWEFEP